MIPIFSTCTCPHQDALEPLTNHDRLCPVRVEHRSNLEGTLAVYRQELQIYLRRGPYHHKSNNVRWRKHRLANMLSLRYAIHALRASLQEA